MLMTTYTSDHAWTIWLPLIAGIIAVGILGTFNAVSLSHHRKNRFVCLFFTCIFIVCVIYTLLATVERLIWVTCERSYPAVIAVVGDEKFSKTDFENIENKCRTDFSVKELPHHQVAIRCGYWWPTRTVWLITTTHYRAITQSTR